MYVMLYVLYVWDSINHCQGEAIITETNSLYVCSNSIYECSVNVNDEGV